MKRIFVVFALYALSTGACVICARAVCSPTIGIGVMVSDLHRALEFYTNVIGMIQTGSFEIKEDFSRKSGLANALPTQVKILPLGEGENATQWKLMSFGDFGR